MALLNRIGACGIPHPEMSPVGFAGFQEGAAYEQVDLGGRDVVEGIAHWYLRTTRTVGHFTMDALNLITSANHSDPGHFVVYAGPDQTGVPIAYVYERVEVASS